MGRCALGWTFEQREMSTLPCYGGVSGPCQHGEEFSHLRTGNKDSPVRTVGEVLKVSQ